MKAYFILLVIFAAIECKSAKFVARQILTNRLQKYVYFSTNEVEKVISTVNRSDINSLNEYLIFKLPEDADPTSVESLDTTFMESDQVCISNTFFSILFTIFTFCSACSIVIASQLLNYKKKEFKAKKKSSLLEEPQEIEMEQVVKEQQGLTQTNVGKSKKAKKEARNN